MPAARFANILIGIWLFVSAFLWADTPEQFTNTWICGVLCAAFALIALGADWARYLNTALAVWLFISTWALDTVNPATVWNNVIASIAIFVISLIGIGRFEIRGTHEPHAPGGRA